MIKRIKIDQEKCGWTWKNEKKTSNRVPPNDSWIDFWKENSGEKCPEECSVQGCSDIATDGAHVICDEIAGEYIIPMCKKCNNPNNTESFKLKIGTVAVSANASKI